tara:strand:- start:1185 stop:1400 length:216 start_codon:yes stop_codon:yes gene_type:complete
MNFEGDAKKWFIALFLGLWAFYRLIGLGDLGSEYLIAIVGILIVLSLMFYGGFRVLGKLLIVFRALDWAVV